VIYVPNLRVSDWLRDRLDSYPYYIGRFVVRQQIGCYFAENFYPETAPRCAGTYSPAS